MGPTSDIRATLCSGRRSRPGLTTRLAALYIGAGDHYPTRCRGYWISAKLRLVISQGAYHRRPAANDRWRAVYGWIWVGYLVAFGWGVIWLFR